MPTLYIDDSTGILDNSEGDEEIEGPNGHNNSSNGGAQGGNGQPGGGGSSGGGGGHSF